MRLLAALVAAGVTATCSSPKRAPEQEDNSEVTRCYPGLKAPRPLAKSPFVLDERMRVVDISPWGDSWLADMYDSQTGDHRFLEIDLGVDPYEIKELVGPAKTRITSIIPGTSKKLALVTADDRLAIYNRVGSQWENVEVPTTLAAHTTLDAVVADRDNLVAFREGKVWHRSMGRWREFQLPPPTSDLLRDYDFSSCQAALVADTLYLGMSVRTESEGGLVAVDLTSETWSRLESPVESNVGFWTSRLRKDQKGALWAVEGQMVRTTSVRELGPTGWKQFVWFEDGPPLNWEFDTEEVLRDISFGKDGRTHVLSTFRGILRFDNGVWSQLTRPWYDLATPQRMEMVDGNRALVAAKGYGLLLWHFDPQRVEQISLPSPN